MQFEELISLFVGAGVAGRWIVAGILVAVLLAKKSGFVATGNQARLANGIMAAILAGLSGDPNAETALIAAVSAVLAGLSHNLLEWVGDQVNAPWLVQLLGVNKTPLPTAKSAE